VIQPSHTEDLEYDHPIVTLPFIEAELNPSEGSKELEVKENEALKKVSLTRAKMEGGVL